MKKYIIFAAAMVAMCACAKVESEDNGPGTLITFQAANYVPQTKAIAADTEFSSFKCKAYMHAEGINLSAAPDYAPSSAGGFQNFFGNAGNSYTETISGTGYTDANNNSEKDANEYFTSWVPSHSYYWPKSTHSFINFVGWYGNTGTDPNVTYAWNSTSSKYEATLTWDFTTSLGSASSNLLYADMAWRYNANGTNTAHFTDPVTDPVTSGVPMLFHHALAQICVKSYATGTSVAKGTGTDTDKVTDGTATWTITLENIAVGTIATEGQLSMTNADPGSKATQPWTMTGTGWTASTSASVNVSGTFKVNEVSSANAVTVIANSCVVPQDVSEATLSGKVRVVTTYANGETNSELIPFTVGFHDMGTDTWAQNHLYTYFVKYNPSQNTVTFDPAIDAAYQTINTTEQSIL